MDPLVKKVPDPWCVVWIAQWQPGVQLDKCLEAEVSVVAKILMYRGKVLALSCLALLT